MSGCALGVALAVRHDEAEAGRDWRGAARRRGPSCRAARSGCRAPAPGRRSASSALRWRLKVARSSRGTLRSARARARWRDGATRSRIELEDVVARHRAYHLSRSATTWMSPTLVPVGPVRTRSPSAVEETHRCCCRRRIVLWIVDSARRGARASVVRVDDGAGRVGGAVDAVGPDARRRTTPSHPAGASARASGKARTPGCVRPCPLPVHGDRRLAGGDHARRARQRRGGTRRHAPTCATRRVARLAGDRLGRRRARA